MLTRGGLHARSLKLLFVLGVDLSDRLEHGQWFMFLVQHSESVHTSRIFSAILASRLDVCTIVGAVLL